MPSSNLVAPDAFRDTLGRFASGVTVVTVLDERTPRGVTVSAFCSLSLDPPLVMLALAKTGSRMAAVRRGPFAVHVLGEAQAAVSQAFAQELTDPFQTVAWEPDEHGLPRLDGVAARIVCRTAATHDGGDHWIIVGDVTALQPGAVAPLLYHRGRYGRFSLLG